MTTKKTTQDFMLHLADARIKKLVDELKAEKSFNKALQADNDRLHDLLDESEDNVKRVSLLMSELKLKDAIKPKKESDFKFKVAVMPFLVGAYGYGIHSGEFDFAIASTFIFSILLLTKQVKLI